MLGKLLEKLTSLAILAALGWGAWYGYSHWSAASSSSTGPAPEAAFNCRQAVARLAEDYACRNSDSCTMTDNDLIDLENREADIERYCN